LSDIKRLISALDPARNQVYSDIPLSTTMQVREDNKSVEYRVESKTRSKSRRDMLVEGLTIIKNRADVAEKLESGETIEINGHPMRPAHLGNGVQGSNWVDPIIKHWLGGYRNGILVCWDLDDGYTYRYDIFLHRLTRIEREARPSTSGPVSQPR
jgi:hypothetical protein